MVEYLIELLKVFGLLTLILLLCSIIVNIIDQWIIKYRQRKAIQELFSNPDELIKLITSLDEVEDKKEKEEN